MKPCIVFLFFAVSSICFAQTDSVFVEKADGTIIGYAVSAIREITFSGLPTSIREQELLQNVLSSFTLHQNYPNPFNPTTTIQYDIPHTGEVTIAIYDIQGRLIRSLANLTEQAGTHSVVWDARNDGGVNVSSGNYFCRVDFNHSFLVQKLLLLK
ncbi:MAG: T9SS type A sorting domain-containing protein [Ignavibacteriales bacterium]|nr:T9SS type A sorting domain-containing protein [Ignavibacteriales bacterium]